MKSSLFAVLAVAFCIGVACLLSSGLTVVSNAAKTPDSTTAPATPTVKMPVIDFVEYDLPNGLHVILHQNKTAPVVATYVYYHVGSKNERPDRTGFAHFF